MKFSPRETARVFSALSDVTRVEIVRLVAKGPRNVTQLTSLVGVSQPKVSRHLRILRDAGLLTDVRRGKWVWYELAEPSKGQPGSAAISAIDSLFSGKVAAVSRREVGVATGRRAVGGERLTGTARNERKSLGQETRQKPARRAGPSRSARKRTVRSVPEKRQKQHPATPRVTPSQTAKRKATAPRETKDFRKTELEDFLL